MSFLLTNFQILTLLPIIFIIEILFIIIILYYHSLHNLKTFLKCVGIIRRIFLFLLLLVNFFLLSFRFLIKLRKIGIKYFPLSNISLKSIRGRWFSWDSSFTDYAVDSLAFSWIVVKFISHSFFYGFFVFRCSWIFLLLLSDGFIDKFVLNIFDFFLSLILIRFFPD